MVMHMSESVKTSTVALIACDTYDEEQVYGAVKAGIDLIGGISRFVKPGEKIVMKPNVLVGTSPEHCVCTHPSVMKAAGRILLEADVKLSCGDSSAFGKCEVNMRRAGLKQAADELGISLADFDKGRVVTNKEALMNERFIIANAVLEADGVVSLSKLKTHEFTRFTGAVKNQFGCIPGALKSQFHARLPDPYQFGAMLVDVTTLVKPRLYIMDAIVAMEGNGPRSGNPRKLGVLLFSSDPVALDAVACRIIDLNPELVPTFEPGERAGLGTYHYDNITVVGHNIEEFISKDFAVVRRPIVSATSRGVARRMRVRLSTYIRRKVCPKPTIDKTRCTSCGTCVRLCPVSPKAVHWRKGDESRPPVHDYNNCIRCFCCQEVCPEGAISVTDPLLSKILSRIYGVIMR
jgi:uncharacterized protein (DUF362 family)/ferredoxin